MKCSEFRKIMDRILDAHPDAEASDDLVRHAESCPACHGELAEVQAILADLHPSMKVHASNQFKERVMIKAMEMENRRRLKVTRDQRYEMPQRSWTWRVAVAAALLVVFFGGFAWLSGGHNGTSAAGFSTLVQAAETMSHFTTMHLSCKMRTVPEDNFEYIDFQHEMIPIDIWAQSGEPEQWRVEKAGRVVVNDGQSTLMLIWQGNDRTRAPQAIIAGPDSGCVGWLKPMLDMEHLFTHEIDTARRDGATLTLNRETGSDGQNRAIVTIEAKAKGDFSRDDYARNSSIEESDNTRVYCFDDVSKRLVSMQVFVKVDGKKVLVFEVTTAEYDTELKADIFSTRPPTGAMSLNINDVVNAGITAANGPKEVAGRFFEALAKGDRSTIGQIMPVLAQMMASRPEMAKYFIALKVVSLGTPFKSGMYPGWYVPYEIRFANGETKKMNLAVRNDQNPKGLWQVDGGF
jgi:hypothetical protein